MKYITASDSNLQYRFLLCLLLAVAAFCPTRADAIERSWGNEELHSKYLQKLPAEVGKTCL